MSAHHYGRHAGSLKAELGLAQPRSLHRALHQRTAWRHLTVAARQFLPLAVTTAVLVIVRHPLVGVPLAVVQGFTIFNVTVLLHEVVHSLALYARRGMRARTYSQLVWAWLVENRAPHTDWGREEPVVTVSRQPS